jgi:hypothetical protein
VRRAVVIAALLFLAPLASPAFAQPAEDDKALALTLFRRGRELMEEKKIAEACESFAESQRLDPGAGTLLNLAVCHEEQGRTATAWAELSDALALARRDQRLDRIELAEKHMSAIEPRLSRLVVLAPRERALRITRNGGEVPGAAIGVAVPVDPGRHVIEAFSGTRSVFRVEIDVAGDGDRRVVDIVPAEVPPEPAPRFAALADASPRAAPVRGDAAPRASSFRPVLGWALVGAGAVSIGAGSFFGIRALDEQSKSDDGCRNGRCTNGAVESNESAKTFADLSTATIGFGALVVAAGVALVLFDR